MPRYHRGNSAGVPPDELRRAKAASLPADPLEREFIRRECVADFSTFIRCAWQHVDSSPFIDAWHIRVMAAYLQAFADRKIRNLIINIPPGHGKSLVVSVLFPAWQWLRNPQEQYLCATHSESLTVRDSLRCRHLIRHPWYTTLFGSPYKILSDQDEKSYYVNDAGGFRYSMGVTSAGTGWRGTMKIIDDPLDQAAAASDAKRTAVIEWYDQKMMSRLVDPTFGNLIIMQRLHDADLVGHVLSKYSNDFEHLCLQARYKPAELPPNCNRFFKDPRRNMGNGNALLFQGLYNLDKIRMLELALGPYGTASQLQQAPRPRDGGFFKAQWFERYERARINPARDFVQCFQSWDCAVKDKPTNDRAAGQVWAQLRESHPDYPNAFVLWDAVCEQADIVRNLSLIRMLTEKHPYAQTKLIEDKANGSPIITMLQKQFGDSSGVVPFDPQSRSKEVRAEAVVPVCAAGRVLIPRDEDAPWVASWLAEITAFNTGKHDDQVDATTQALLHLTQGGQWVFAC